VNRSRKREIPASTRLLSGVSVGYSASGFESASTAHDRRNELALATAFVDVPVVGAPPLEHFGFAQGGRAYT
jgi:hypothetical protein